MAEEKQKYVSAMESLKKKLTKSRSQTAAVVEDTGRVIEAQAVIGSLDSSSAATVLTHAFYSFSQIVIGELRDEVNKLMGDCNSLRKSMLFDRVKIEIRCLFYFFFSLKSALRTREGPARFVDVASAGINTELNW